MATQNESHPKIQVEILHPFQNLQVPTLHKQAHDWTHGPSKFHQLKGWNWFLEFHLFFCASSCLQTIVNRQPCLPRFHKQFRSLREGSAGSCMLSLALSCVVLSIRWWLWLIGKEFRERFPEHKLHGRTAHGLNHFLCKDFIKFPLQTCFHGIRKDKAGEMVYISVSFNFFIFVNYSKERQRHATGQPKKKERKKKVQAEKKKY